MDFFCVAPGSRSTPLAAALASNPKARSLIHFDERGTAFAALGYARATGRPAVWVTTSGTAVANGLPAVVEASVDGVPMVLLTADRPPELRQIGANQTIDQPDIFGDYVRWRFDFPAPDANIEPAVVLTTVDQAVYRSRRAPEGPVHLNLMFREPFLPDEEDEPHFGPEEWERSDEPYTRYADTKPAVDEAEIERLWEELRPVERGLIVAGRLSSRKQGEAVMRLANALGWPLLPDIGSQVRLGADSGNAVAYYDALLSSESFAGSHAPEAVLHVGGRALSKRLEKFVAGSRPESYVVVRENPFRLDPSHRVTRSVESDIVDFCAALGALYTSSALETGWLSEWRDASESVGRSLDRLLSDDDAISEPLVARLVSRHVPAEHGLVLASSMPVRDLDTFAVADGAPVPVAANRGASGIDGTVATTAGFVHGSGAPATLVIGDLALLHDLNSLAMLRDLSVVVVAVNNDGGGIFSFLPVAEHGEFFESYFGTPQGVSFRPAAEMFGLDYEQPGAVAEFLEAYRAACVRGTSTLIEVKTNREENVALHRKLLEEITSAIGRE